MFTRSRLTPPRLAVAAAAAGLLLGAGAGPALAAGSHPRQSDRYAVRGRVQRNLPNRPNGGPPVWVVVTVAD